MMETAQQQNFWTTKCNDFHDIDSNQSAERTELAQATNEEFIYPSDNNSRATIVGIAIKRSLKINDEMKILDHLQNSVLQFAPMAELDETLSEEDEEDDAFIEHNHNDDCADENDDDEVFIHGFKPLSMNNNLNKDIFLTKLKEKQSILENIGEHINEDKYKNTIDLLKNVTKKHEYNNEITGTCNKIIEVMEQQKFDQQRDKKNRDEGKITMVKIEQLNNKLNGKDEITASMENLLETINKISTVSKKHGKW